jgi:hypothetical protein
MSVLIASLFAILPQGAFDAANAPGGTGLEWMTVTAVVIPALLIVALVYLGTKSTV